MDKLKIEVAGTNHTPESIEAIAKAVEKDLVDPRNCTSHQWWAAQTAARLLRKQLSIILTLRGDLHDKENISRTTEKI